MDWNLNLASLLLRQNPIAGAEGLRYELERRVVELYTTLLSYQITSICSYYRHRGLEFLRDIVQLNDWDASLERVHKAEAILRQDLTQYDMQQIVSQLGRIAASTESIDKKLVDQPKEPLTAGPPKDLWIVPLDRNRDFVGRESVLEQLLGKISPNDYKDTCQRTAVEGLGGVGKTQIALEAAYRIYEEHRCCVFWVPAVDATTFENAYYEIGKQLYIRDIDEDKADVKFLVKEALSQSTYNWLLIIDNADDIELLFAGAAPLFDYLPSSPRGSILFTTRNYATAVKLGVASRNIVSAAEMSPTEALELLKKSLKDDQIGSSASATELLSFLSHLPLAIKQASTYMAETRMSTIRYLHHCRSSDKTFIKLLSKNFADQGRYEGIKNPVATTWLISFNHISRANPLAAQYLKFMCFLAEKDIPISLLPPADELEADEALGILKAYAFVTEHRTRDSYDVHRLVRLAMQNWLAEKGEELNRCVTSIFQRLNEVFPYPMHENRAIWGTYLPHLLKALEFSDKVVDEIKTNLLFNIGTSTFILGKYDKAETMHRQALQGNIKMLGTEHPYTLSSMNDLARVLERQGKYDEAETMYRQVLQRSNRVLGTEHPDTLTSMKDLALVFEGQGKYNEAETMLRQVFENRTKVLGTENPGTLISMSLVARMLEKQGKYDEAKTMHQQALQLHTKVLGTEHPHTLTSMSDLGHVFEGQGKYDEAETLHQQALQLYTKVLGTEHPYTLSSMNNLARVLERQGKYDEAKTLHQQALQLRTKVLGTEHPSTLTSISNLAFVFERQGKYNEAKTMHWQVLQGSIKVLGTEHPDTLTSMSLVARMLERQGQYDEAETMHQQVLQLRTKVLGTEHPDTLISMTDVAYMLVREGKYDEAEIMYRQVLQSSIKVLGTEHPDTLASMNDLARVFERQGKYNEAEIMYRQVLQSSIKVLGTEHPGTLTSMNDLARVLERQGKYDEAKTMHR
jgi:tetratricopeptide (TPR) repeat protein